MILAHLIRMHVDKIAVLLFVVYFSKTKAKPNIILLFADDVGWGDLSSFGHPTQEWGPLDDMVEQGLKFTHFTTAASVCTPSRSALMTSRYSVRTGMYGPKRKVLIPDSHGGLPRQEITIAEGLKEVGYTTGMVGKWHLGINAKDHQDGSHLPYNHGFDFVGANLPLMQCGACDPKAHTVKVMSDWCYLYKNATIFEQPYDTKTLTQKLVDDATGFIGENKDNPFFFYFAFPQTHIAMFCDDRFCGKSIRGSYGDNVNEMSWASGEILNKVKSLGIENNTLVIFSSDHGPYRAGCTIGGSAGPFRGGKADSYEGGVRVPGIAWWPGTIKPKTTTHSVVNLMDIFPTALDLAGFPNLMREKNVLIDGKSIAKILTGENDESPHESLFHYCSDRLFAVRTGKYKVHYYTMDQPDYHKNIRYPHCSNVTFPIYLAKYDCYGAHVTKHDPPLVFDVDENPGEDAPMEHTDKRDFILELADKIVKKHLITLTVAPSEIDKVGGEHLRPCCNPPSCICNYKEESAEKTCRKDDTNCHGDE